jgi:hypothetical protein
VDCKTLRKLLVTIATENILPFCQEILETQRLYAQKNDYQYRLIGQLHWGDLHPSFSKVWEIHTGLEEGFDFIIWADADVAFMNSNVDLANLVEEEFFVAAYHQQNWKSWRYLCCGLSVWRNCKEAIGFVNDWIQRVEKRFMKDHPFEQWYFDEKIRERNYNGVRCCTAQEIGCFCPEIWHDGTVWQRGMPTIHLAGPTDWSTRQKIFKEKYQGLVT